MGSIHLFFDLQLQSQRSAAETSQDSNEDIDSLSLYAVPTSGSPKQPWHYLPSREKQNAKDFCYPQRLGEDPKDRCIADLLVKFQNFLQTAELDMTIGECTTAFQSAITQGSVIYPMAIGRDMRSFGVDLALSDPTYLFMAHEWLQKLYLRPQPDAHAWLAATAVFGPLFYHQDVLVEEVVNAMHLVEDVATGGLDEERISDDNDSDTEVHLVDQIPIKKSNKRKKDSKASSDDASSATGPAGVAVLHQQQITGNNRQHQLRYDLRLFCPPSKDADKTLMAAAKK
jgi:hypothetical protein